MNTNSAKPRLLASAALLGCASILLALITIPATGQQSGDPACTVPGPVVVTDTAQNDSFDGQAVHDIVSTSVAHPSACIGTAGNLYFTIKVASLSTLTPGTFYYTTFTVDGAAPTEGSVYGVRMVVNDTGTASFESYQAGASNAGTVDGRFVDAAQPAESGSNYTADGTITIIVKPSSVGVPSGSHTLTNWNGAVAETAGGVVTAILDGMPSTTGSPPSTITRGGTPFTVVTPTPTPTPPPSGGPRFFNHYAPPGFLEDAGEPTMGVNWNTENVSRPNPGDQTFTNQLRDGTATTIPNGGTSLYYGGINNYFLRANFDDCSSPARVDWAQIPLEYANTQRAFFDPILYTDHWTGRTFVCQEAGLTPAGSTMEWTDNDGDDMYISQGGAPSGGIDHQTVGGGPFHAPGRATTVTPKIPSTPGATPVPSDPSATPYPHAVYYASQSVATATSQLSIDGGFTYPDQHPMFTAADCAGLHGHLKVAEDGTAYVPDKACAPQGVPFVFGGHPAVVVSEDNGETWTVRIVPNADSDAGVRDPSVGVSWCPPGTCSPEEKTERSKHIYLGYMYTDGRPGIAYSNNKGETWARVVDLGALTGIKHSVFHAVVVGDPGRASMTFLGTKTAGAWNTPAFPGEWHLYAATTYDFGQTWDVQNISPEGPIQRGGICGDGTCRNLLDFQDTQLDKQGRILVAGQDGCIGGCEISPPPDAAPEPTPPNSFTAKAFISRQTGGKRLFAIYDAATAEPHLPGAPDITGGHNAADTKVTLTWRAPDHGGAAITHYNIYRSNVPAPDWSTLTPIASVTEPRYIDTTFPAGEERYYIVTAVNSVGEGPYCQVFHPPLLVEPDPCTLPGIMVNNDVFEDGSDDDAGANTPPDPRVNVRQSFVAEPFTAPGSDQLIFTMQVEPFVAALPPPDSQWFIIWNRQGPNSDGTDPNDHEYDRMYVAMATDAAGAPHFDYGKFGHPIDTSIPPPPPDGFENTPVKFGDADGGSYDPLTGVIQIFISKAKLRAIDGGNNKYQANTDLAGMNVRTYLNRPDYQPDATPPVTAQRSQNNAADITSDATYTLRGNLFCAPQNVTLVRASSRKLHGTAGEYSVRLFPLADPGTVAIEPRLGSGAQLNQHQVVFVFATPVTFSGATATPGSGGSAAIQGSPTTSGNEVVVNFTASNAQTLNITLQAVEAGGAPTDVSVPIALLAGDVNATRLVDGNDVSAVQGQTRQPLENANFRMDVNTTGLIDGNDVSAVQGKTRTRLR